MTTEEFIIKNNSLIFNQKTNLVIKFRNASRALRSTKYLPNNIQEEMSDDLKDTLSKIDKMKLDLVRKVEKMTECDNDMEFALKGNSVVYIDNSEGFNQRSVELTFSYRYDGYIIIHAIIELGKNKCNICQTIEKSIQLKDVSKDNETYKEFISSIKRQFEIYKGF